MVMAWPGRRSDCISLTPSRVLLQDRLRRGKNLLHSRQHHSHPPDILHTELAAKRDKSHLSFTCSFCKFALFSTGLFGTILLAPSRDVLGSARQLHLSMGRPCVRARSLVTESFESPSISTCNTLRLPRRPGKHIDDHQVWKVMRLVSRSATACRW